MFRNRSPVFLPFRSDNIEKGLPWFQAVEEQLASADAALLSITPENADSPWMHYEAGAISNRFLLKDAESGAKAERLKARLFTYLFGMDSKSEVKTEMSDTVSRVLLSYALRILEARVEKRSASPGDTTIGLDSTLVKDFVDVLLEIESIESGIVSQVAPRAADLRSKLQHAIAAAA